MKKIFSLLIIVLMAPIVVLADAAGPAIIGYDAVIINKNGIKVNNGDEQVTIAYNTKVHVYDEPDEGKVSFCTNWKDGSCDGESYETSSSNIASTKNELTPNDYKYKDSFGTSLIKKANKYIIFAKSGVKLSKGPADIFDKYDKVIPYLEVLESTYYTSRGMGIKSWAYIDSNGYKGWIDLSKEDVGIYPGELLTFGSTDLLDDNDNVIDKITNETIITTSYSYNDKYYIKYNDKYGFVKINKQFNVGVKTDGGYILTTSEVKMTSGDGNVVGNIPVGEKVKILYSGIVEFEGDAEYYYPYAVLGKFYVEYNGKKGYVNEKEVMAIPYDYDITKMAVKNNTKLYDIKMIDDNTKSGETIDTFINRFKVVDTIPAGGTITIYKDAHVSEDDSDKAVIVYVAKYKDKVGCIVKEVGDNEEEENTTPTPTATPKEIVEDNPTPTPQAKDDNNVATKTDKNDNLILICIIVSVVVSVIAIVSAVLVNKKSKKEFEKKLEEVKKEVKEEPKAETKTEPIVEKPVETTENNPETENKKEE